ncbi:voltage-dependent calcium channel gamma-5 subunit isoform X1 [Paroedura picta]|uniref:voltage-dependent calcium channel gamma-5 subunit isoform X1 n=1 Tax=Paroedura picta TaxID=143630 RepID=UPI004057BF47
MALGDFLPLPPPRLQQLVASRPPKKERIKPRAGTAERAQSVAPPHHLLYAADRSRLSASREVRGGRCKVDRAAAREGRARAPGRHRPSEGEEHGRCFTIEYIMPMNVQLTSESTVNVLKMVRSATPFPLVSLFFMFIGFILSNIGHIRPHRTILAFVSGIFFILSGLSLVVGLVLYISSINDEILNRTKDSETYFTYRYGWSFAFSAISFLLTESAGVMSVYLFMKRYTAEERYRPHPGFYHPRLSNCSDYSGQFLHPDAWVRGRSPSDISSDASLQMNSNYPALLKCPDYDQMSSSPC